MRPKMKSNGSVANDQSPSASATAKVQFCGAESGCGKVMSRPRTCESGCWVAKAMDQIPVPQPMSRIRWLNDDGDIGAV